MRSEIAIRAENLSKTFLIPHERHDTFRERLMHFEWKKKYESFEALKDVSFEIMKGEFFGIIGRNGSGKSTLLKILAGIYTPDKGKVSTNGAISPFLELGVGFNPELSGRDNIYLNGTILGLSGKEIRTRFDSIVDFSELERFIDLKLKNYSSGMQVRLAFAVAIHANREILLMDEVLAVGDASFQIKCFEAFEEMIKSGKTIVFVSHDTNSMQKYAERVLYLESGNASFIGASDEALTKYMYTDIIKESKSVDQRLELINEGLEGIEQDNSNDRSTVKLRGTQKAFASEKIVEFIEIQFFESGNKPSDVLINGNQMEIKIIFNVTQKMENLILGIIIRNHLHQDLFVTNTFTENVSTGEMLPGKYIIIISMVNVFAPGKYSVSPAICDQTQRMFYDWRDDFGYFNVLNPKRLISYGGIEVPHEIIISKYNP